MKIVNQSYEIISPDVLNEITAKSAVTRIEEAGRTCYKSESKGDPGSFVRHIVNRGHLSVIEHANLTVRFITDRGVTHELVRHRLAAYSQESTRYCDYSGDMEFIRPVWVSPDNLNRLGWEHQRLLQTPEDVPSIDFTEAQIWINSCLEAQRYYEVMRKMGWRPEQARAVLPNSLKTEIIMTANLREWLHVFSVRTTKAAHPQIRELMRPLQKELQTYLPEIFGEVDNEE